ISFLNNFIPDFYHRTQIFFPIFAYYYSHFFSPLQISIYQTDYTNFQQSNQGEALYIIRSLSAVYHQCEALHLIKPQLIQPSADNMRLRR
ncbi:MAG: hypothetical protein IJ465_03285, partial [Clostridia bacterium]|nr:hypothetical protein [Clostridia bacterium]